MATHHESSLDRLWSEYLIVFNDFDDLTLARWMAQTLGQLSGRAWRLSHPLVAVYRLAAQAAHNRQIWLKRLANAPANYVPAPCCRAPLLPLVTRDVVDSGLLCQHCDATVIPFDDIADALQSDLRAWAESYGPVHAIAHQEEPQSPLTPAQEQSLETAAATAEKLLAVMGRDIAPRLLDFYPAIIWEDQDECLEVRPEDIRLS
jgi:hypothetical protein